MVQFVWLAVHRVALGAGNIDRQRYMVRERGARQAGNRVVAAVSYLIHDIDNGEAREQHLARASHIPPKGEANLFQATLKREQTAQRGHS